MHLVEQYLRAARNWRDIHSFDRSQRHIFSYTFYGVLSKSTRPYGKSEK